MGEVWQAGSTVTLCYVPWDSSYNRVVQFHTVDEQAAYFEDAAACSPRLTIGGNTYVRPNVPLVVDGPYSKIHRYNYCVVDNPEQPVDGSEAERLFYFITGAEYVSPASTRITLQLDVWQTRVIHDGASFGAAYCDRGHVAVSAASAASGSYGFTRRARRYLDVPEGLDIGSDYTTIVTGSVPLGTTMYTVILSTADLTADPGTVSAPALETAHGGFCDGIPGGAEAYLLTTNEDLVRLFSKAGQYSWVAQCIIGVYGVPSFFVSTSGASQVTIFNDIAAYTQFSAAGGVGSEPIGDVTDYMPSIAKTYDKVRCYPYSAIELFSTSNGNSVYFKPQYLTNDRLDYQLHECVAPPFIRGVIAANNYLAADTGSASMQFASPSYKLDSRATVYTGEWLSSSLNVADFPQFPLVTSGYLTYMASTAHSRTYSYDSAGWSLAASTASANNAYETQRRALATNAANQSIQNRLTNEQQFYSVAGGAVGVVGNLLSGNIGGAASSGIGTALNYLSSESAQNASNATFANNQSLAAANADANQRLAEYVNQGNYQNAIAGINATVQDAQLTPPSQAGMTGGDGWALSNEFFAVLVRYKMLTKGSAAVVLSYFAKYGYAVHEWVEVPQDLCLMEQVTYWRVIDVPVACATANDSEVQVIKGIFENGVSVYDAPDKLDDAGLMSNTVKVSANYYVNKEV